MYSHITFLYSQLFRVEQNQTHMQYPLGKSKERTSSSNIKSSLKYQIQNMF